MKLNTDRMHAADYVRNVFSVTAPIGVAVSDLTNPEFWTHVASKLHPTDHIEVIAEDGTYFAELFVISAGGNWAKVAVLRQINLEYSGEAVPPVEGYYVKWSSPHTKYRAHRTSDKEVLKDGFATAAQAHKWLGEYVKTLNT